MPRRYLFTPDPVGGGTTVSTGVGELTLTGYAPTVTVPVIVNAGVGALTLTGYAPTVLASISVLTGAGALVLTGYAPDVSVTANTTVATDVAALVLTGYAPSISKTDHVTVSTGVGALEITGYAPTVFETAASPTVNVGVAELLLTTYAPIVVNSGDAVPAGEQPAGRSSKRRTKDKRRRIIVDGQLYDVPERDVPALLEAKLLNRKPPSTAEPVQDKPEPKAPRKPAQKAAEAAQPMVWVQPTVDEAQARYEALLQEVQAQAEVDVARLLDKVAIRVLQEIEDDEDAAIALLLA